ncbi:MAG: hypothetical protein DLM53_10740 [Candidatus Eremiobacter antarcticus]|nr:MAG: hypothetical protein DLM53_10740 [Candidatus Eremiobacter sp. RRmetagenome_bin22]
MLAAACLARPLPLRSEAAVLHPTVSVQGAVVTFYAGHLVLDARAGSLSDGVLTVTADRIIVDLRANRYVAAGSVTVLGSRSAHGDALGMDLLSHRGVLISSGAATQKLYLDGASMPLAQNSEVPGRGAAAQPADPLSLPDVGTEQPYAVAPSAVAHLGADVRLRRVRVLVPGGQTVPLPSYVYTFSTDSGYVVSNVNAGAEDLPIYFGSTPNSIQGAHFFYNPLVKLGIGFDDHIVFGQRAYDLISLSPVNGPTKTFNVTWQQHINDHASQTFFSSTTTGIGTSDNYDVRDSIHRSFLELTASQFRGNHGSTLAWQSYDQPLGATASSSVYFHLRSEYGYQHVPEEFSFAPFAFDAVLPRTVFHKAVEGYIASQPWRLNPSTSLGPSIDVRAETDTLPHRQTSETYIVTLQHRWTRDILTTVSASETPILDRYPSVATGYRTHFSEQTVQVYYDRGDAFSLFLTGVHSAARSDNPSPPAVPPWTLLADVRFRVTPSLSLDLSRSYFFGYNGRRFGSFGFQILP